MSYTDSDSSEELIEYSDELKNIFLDFSNTFQTLEEEFEEIVEEPIQFSRRRGRQVEAEVSSFVYKEEKFELDSFSVLSAVPDFEGETSLKENYQDMSPDNEDPYNIDKAPSYKNPYLEQFNILYSFVSDHAANNYAPYDVDVADFSSLNNPYDLVDDMLEPETFDDDDDDYDPYSAVITEDEEAKAEDWDTIFGAGETDRNVSEIDWFERYISAETELERNILYEQFVIDATQTAKFLISDLSLKEEDRVFKTRNVGGFAGGKKFVYNGIFYKVGEDANFTTGKFLYGKTKRDDFLASKVLKRETRAVREISRYRTETGERVYGPLLCCIDYLGITVMAISLIQLQDHVLIHGSRDAGKTFATPHCTEIYQSQISPDTIDNFRIKMSDYFHFSRHKSRFSNFSLDFSGDVEIYVNLNKPEPEYYCVDLGRFFPTNDFNNPFSNFFRCEFIQAFKYEIPKLNTDAGSGWTTYNVDEITKHSEVISLQMKFMEQEFLEQLVSEDGELFLQRNNIVELFHENGLNLRFLGTVRNILIEKYLTNHQLDAYLIASNFLLEEMMFRLFKVCIRKIKYTNFNSYLQTIQNALDISERDDIYWSTITKMLEEKYGRLTDVNSFWNPLVMLEKHSPYLKIYRKKTMKDVVGANWSNFTESYTNVSKTYEDIYEFHLDQFFKQIYHRCGCEITENRTIIGFIPSIKTSFNH